MRKEELASKIRDYRKKKGMSQEALADKSGINHRTIQRIENSENMPTGDTLMKIAAALDISSDELIDIAIKEDNGFLLKLNLSAFSFLLFPILGILIPFMLWSTQKEKIKRASSVGKSVINFQVSWLLLLITLPICLYLGGMTGVIGAFTFKSFFIIVIVMYVLNVVFIIMNTFRTSHHMTLFYPYFFKILR